MSRHLKKKNNSNCRQSQSQEQQQKQKRTFKLFTHNHHPLRNISIFLIVSIVLISQIPVVSASVGDRLPEFKECVSQCISKTCRDTIEETITKTETETDTDIETKNIPFYLQLLFWTCPQNCDYECQREVTADRIQLGLSIEQFHGKWPFIRILGIQEPLSVLFSILNFIPHYFQFKRFIKTLKSHNNNNNNNNSQSTQLNTNIPTTLIYVYLGVTITGMNAWIWSSVFHVRDFVLTERLDYFSAGLTVLYGFYAASVRVFRLDRNDEKSIALRYGLIIVCVIAYISHVSYLSFVTFSYSYNMLANVIVGLLQNFLWIFHSISEYRKYGGAGSAGESWRLWPLFIVLTVTGAMSFELFDFPPVLDLLDAHALWHAGTVLPTYWWYFWMEKDIRALKNSKVKI